MMRHFSRVFALTILKTSLPILRPLFGGEALRIGFWHAEKRIVEGLGRAYCDPSAALLLITSVCLIDSVVAGFFRWLREMDTQASEHACVVIAYASHTHTALILFFNCQCRPFQLTDIENRF